jgi:hypothetical protein
MKINNIINSLSFLALNFSIYAESDRKDPLNSEEIYSLASQVCGHLMSSNSDNKGIQRGSCVLEKKRNKRRNLPLSGSNE